MSGAPSSNDPKTRPLNSAQPDLAQIVLGAIEFLRHAALTLDAALESDAGEVAVEVVAPAVIDAGDALDIAAALEAQQRAAVRAAIYEAMQCAALVARDHDRRLADGVDDEIAGLCDLGGEAEIIPGRAFEDTHLFARVFRGVGVDAIGHLMQALRRPCDVARFGIAGHFFPTAGIPGRRDAASPKSINPAREYEFRAREPEPRPE